jgi:putative hydrolase of HD superfamily
MAAAPAGMGVEIVNPYERLARQMAFIVEIDKMKRIYRQNYVINGGERRETDAEHSWHLAVMALLLAEHTDRPVDGVRAAKMALLHDLVEIDAGDTYCYDQAGLLDQAEREQQAAKRIFGLLPDDQAGEWIALWEEFEAGLTPEARFAAALDRLQPLLLHYHTEGRSWQEHGITSAKVIERNKRTKEISQNLAALVAEIIENAVGKGYLPR